MKKILFIFAFVLLLTSPAKAQFVRYGFKLGNGISMVTDDLLTSSPVFGFNIGGYVDYSFTNWKNPWSENVYLQVGLNITRRGTNFQRVWVLEPRSIRQGYYHNWYAQIPLIAGFRYELPSLPAENFLNFFVGPTFNVGMFGKLWDREVMPGMPHRSHNYDTFVTGDKDDARSFKNLRRFDVGIVFGVGYQWHNFTVDLYIDHGFIALRKSADVLAPFDVKPDENGQYDFSEVNDRNAYTGTNHTYMISIGYQLPINR